MSRLVEAVLGTAPEREADETIRRLKAKSKLSTTEKMQLKRAYSLSKRLWFKRGSAVAAGLSSFALAANLLQNFLRDPREGLPYVKDNPLLSPEKLREIAQRLSSPLFELKEKMGYFSR